MTKAAAVTGIVLAGVLLWEGFGSNQLLFFAAALLLIVSGVWTWRRHTVAHVFLCLLGLVLLGRSLPLYFRTQRMWPFLPIIGLAAVTLGLGLVGFLLDRYQVPEARDRSL